MNIVSLFSGAGGFDLGLIQSGHSVIWANDIFEDAVATYRHNIGGFVDTRDICDVHSSEIPFADVVMGGFPCQGFSVANWKRSIDDPRNHLYKQMVRVVGEKQPWFFVAENVKGIVSIGKGEALKRIENDFGDAGYSTTWAVLDSADYGVPQRRMRFVMLGVRRDIATQPPEFPPAKTHSGPDRNDPSQPLPHWLQVGQALSHLPEPEDSSSIPNHDYSNYKLTFNGHLGHRFVHPDRPAPSVTGRGDDRGGVVVLHHPSNQRRMSVRELAAVQSFPDDFVFCGTKTSCYRQVANAVPPKLGRAIGEMLSQNEIRFAIQQKHTLPGVAASQYQLSLSLLTNGAG